MILHWLTKFENIDCSNNVLRLPIFTINSYQKIYKSKYTILNSWFFIDWQSLKILIVVIMFCDYQSLQLIVIRRFTKVNTLFVNSWFFIDWQSLKILVVVIMFCDYQSLQLIVFRRFTKVNTLF